MAFPVGPANGALTTINGTVYVYNSTKGAWLKQNVGAVTVTNDLTINGNLIENGNLTVAGSFIPSSDMMYRNVIVNGGMDVWQRGTSGFTTHDTYTADRWWFVNDSVGASSVSQVDISSLGMSSIYALRAERTSGTNRWVVGTQLETIAVKKLFGKTVTCSFKLRKGSALTSNINVTAGTSSTEAKYGAMVDWSGSDLVVTNASLNTSTFTSFSITFSIPSSSSALGFKVEFSANQAGATNAYFDVTDVQVEIGNKASPFETRDYGIELVMCQRYYYQGFFLAGIWGGTAVQGLFSVPVPMRTTPTAGIGGTGVLNMNDTVTGVFSQSSGGWGITSPAAQNLSANYQTFQWAAGNFSGMTAYRMYYQSDYSGGLNNIATLSAEL